MLTVPWCVDDPATIPNTIQTDVVKNKTISYTCSEGYESSDSQQKSVIVTCSPPDTETEPWIWNDTSIVEAFNCTPGTYFSARISPAGKLRPESFKLCQQIATDQRPFDLEISTFDQYCKKNTH